MKKIIFATIFSLLLVVVLGSPSLRHFFTKQRAVAAKQLENVTEIQYRPDHTWVFEIPKNLNRRDVHILDPNTLVDLEQKAAILDLIRKYGNLKQIRNTKNGKRITLKRNKEGITAVTVNSRGDLFIVRNKKQTRLINIGEEYFQHPSSLQEPYQLSVTADIKEEKLILHRKAIEYRQIILSINKQGYLINLLPDEVLEGENPEQPIVVSPIADDNLSNNPPVVIPEETATSIPSQAETVSSGGNQPPTNVSPEASPTQVAEVSPPNDTESDYEEIEPVLAEVNREINKETSTVCNAEVCINLLTGKQFSKDSGVELIPEPRIDDLCHVYISNVLQCVDKNRLMYFIKDQCIYNGFYPVGYRLEPENEQGALSEDAQRSNCHADLAKQIITRFNQGLFSEDASLFLRVFFDQYSQSINSQTFPPEKRYCNSDQVAETEALAREWNANICPIPSASEGSTQEEQDEAIKSYYRCMQKTFLHTGINLPNYSANSCKDFYELVNYRQAVDFKDKQLYLNNALQATKLKLSVKAQLFSEDRQSKMCSLQHNSLAEKGVPVELSDDLTVFYYSSNQSSKDLYSSLLSGSGSSELSNLECNVSSNADCVEANVSTGENSLETSLMPKSDDSPTPALLQFVNEGSANLCVNYMRMPSGIKPMVAPDITDAKPFYIPGSHSFELSLSNVTPVVRYEAGHLEYCQRQLNELTKLSGGKELLEIVVGVSDCSTCRGNRLRVMKAKIKPIFIEQLKASVRWYSSDEQDEGDNPEYYSVCDFSELTPIFYGVPNRLPNETKQIYDDDGVEEEVQQCEEAESTFSTFQEHFRSDYSPSTSTKNQFSISEISQETCPKECPESEKNEEENSPDPSKREISGVEYEAPQNCGDDDNNPSPGGSCTEPNPFTGEPEEAPCPCEEEEQEVVECPNRMEVADSTIRFLTKADSRGNECRYNAYKNPQCICRGADAMNWHVSGTSYFSSASNECKPFQQCDETEFFDITSESCINPCATADNPNAFVSNYTRAADGSVDYSCRCGAGEYIEDQANGGTKCVPEPDCESPKVKMWQGDQPGTKLVCGDPCDAIPNAIREGENCLCKLGFYNSGNTCIEKPRCSGTQWFNGQECENIVCSAGELIPNSVKSTPSGMTYDCCLSPGVVKNGQCVKAECGEGDYQHASLNTKFIPDYAWGTNTASLQDNFIQVQYQEDATDWETDSSTDWYEDQPTSEPTEAPTYNPTDQPTSEPTSEPTESPTDNPTDQPTSEPTDNPTDQPTSDPTEEPTNWPTVEPSVSPTPDCSAPTEGESVSDDNGGSIDIEDEGAEGSDDLGSGTASVDMGEGPQARPEQPKNNSNSQDGSLPVSYTAPQYDRIDGVPFSFSSFEAPFVKRNVDTLVDNLFNGDYSAEELIEAANTLEQTFAAEPTELDRLYNNPVFKELLNDLTLRAKDLADSRRQFYIFINDVTPELRAYTDAVTAINQWLQDQRKSGALSENTILHAAEIIRVITNNASRIDNEKIDDAINNYRNTQAGLGIFGDITGTVGLLLLAPKMIGKSPELNALYAGLVGTQIERLRASKDIFLDTNLNWSEFAATYTDQATKITENSVLTGITTAGFVYGLTTWMKSGLLKTSYLEQLAHKELVTKVLAALGVKFSFDISSTFSVGFEMFRTAHTSDPANPIVEEQAREGAKLMADAGLNFVSFDMIARNVRNIYGSLFRPSLINQEALLGSSIPTARIDHAESRLIEGNFVQLSRKYGYVAQNLDTATPDQKNLLKSELLNELVNLQKYLGKNHIGSEIKYDDNQFPYIVLQTSGASQSRLGRIINKSKEQYFNRSGGDELTVGFDPVYYMMNPSVGGYFSKHMQGVSLSIHSLSNVNKIQGVAIHEFAHAFRDLKLRQAAALKESGELAKLNELQDPYFGSVKNLIETDPRIRLSSYFNYNSFDEVAAWRTSIAEAFARARSAQLSQNAAEFHRAMQDADQAIRVFRIVADRSLSVLSHLTTALSGRNIGNNTFSFRGTTRNRAGETIPFSNVAEIKFRDSTVYNGIVIADIKVSLHENGKLVESSNITIPLIKAKNSLPENNNENLDLLIEQVYRSESKINQDIDGIKNVSYNTIWQNIWYTGDLRDVDPTSGG